MGLIKKIDVPRHFAARRAMRLAAGFPAILPHGTASGEPGGTKAAAAKFVEDFSVEHSSPAAIIPAKE
jgi:hypothetical protein